MEKTDVLIVGGGPAGIQASRMLKTHRPDLRVIVLRPEPFSVIYCAIPYAIEGTIQMDSIAKRDELVTGVGAELWRVRAIEADLDKSIVSTEDGRVIQYQQLLIVTGALPFVPPVPGKNLENILTVKTAADTERIMQLASKARRAVVIGAGAIGIEQARLRKQIQQHTVELEQQVAERLIRALMERHAHKLLQRQRLCFLLTALEQQLANCRQHLHRALVRVIVRFPVPQRVLVQLQPLPPRAAEDHRAQAAIANGQRLHPLCRRSVIPQCQVH